MPETIFIVPERIQSEQPKLQELTLAAEGPSQQHIFYYNQNKKSELKKLLIEIQFKKIVIGYFSPFDDLSWIGSIKSTALKSNIIIYRPDISMLKQGSIDTQDANDMSAWYEVGKKLQYNTLRQADAVIVSSNDEKEMLLKESIYARTIDEIKTDGLAISLKKQKIVSIVMLTFNQRDLTKQCVESLRSYTSYPYELIIVDNGSIDGTKEYLEGLVKAANDVRVIYNKCNVGFSKANNQGIVRASGDYILLLNNDVILTEGWLERLVLCLENNPDIGIVGPCTNKAVGQQVVHLDIEEDNYHIQKYAHIHLMNHAGRWFETHRIIGFCMLIKREVLESVGMLDERFGPGGFEDYDFCMRVRQAGYKIMIAGDVFIYHIGGKGYSDNKMDYDALRQNNVRLFIEKWCRKTMEIMERLP